MQIKKVLLLATLLPMMALVSKAQIKHIEMRVEGMTWNFWAYGVQQHLGRQVGVQKVEVSLRDGTAEVTPKEDGRVEPAQLMKATYDSGVSVAEMDIIARGRIVKGNTGEFMLETSPNQTFAIVPNELSSQLESLAGSDTHVTIRGQLYKKAPGTKKQKQKEVDPLKLTILEIQAKE